MALLRGHWASDVGVLSSAAGPTFIVFRPAGILFHHSHLVGLRSTKSTSCRPLDEHMLLGQRKFRTTFTDEGGRDLEGIQVELAPGTPRDAVRLVRESSTSLSMGC